MNNKEANLKALGETHQTQQKTKEALDRIKQQVALTEEVGAATLQNLSSQGEQLDDINADLKGVKGKLDQTEKLQSQFDVIITQLLSFFPS